MSRVFTSLGENIAIPAADLFNNFTTLTLAAWVNLSDFGAGAPIFIKDLNSYLTYLWVNSDGTLSGNYGNLPTIGPIGAWSVVDGGLGYAGTDTGHTTGTGTVDAPYIIYAIGALGVVTSPDGAGAAPSGPFGEGFAVGETVATTRTSGAGSGLTLHIDSINAQSSVSNSIEAIPLNTWTHVAMTVNSGAIKLYINGVECTYSLQITTGTEDASAGGWNIGSDTFGDNPIGDIAEAAIYTSALSGPQIAALAASTTGAPILPDGYWHLCGNASPEPDASGNGNAGVLSTPAPAKGPNSPGYNCTTGPPNVHFTRLGDAPSGAVTFTDLGTILGEL